MTYWLAQTYLKIFYRKFTVKGECGNGTLQAKVSGDVIILRGYVRRNSGPFGGRENWHGYIRCLLALATRIQRLWWAGLESWKIPKWLFFHKSRSSLKPQHGTGSGMSNERIDMLPFFHALKQEVHNCRSERTNSKQVNFANTRGTQRGYSRQRRDGRWRTEEGGRRGDGVKRK